jgi:hypothetical protein
MKMRWTRFSLICGVILLVVPPSARADGIEDNLMSLIRKVGVHGNMSMRHPTDPDVSKGVTFGPSIGLSPGRSNGWKYPMSLSMFSEDLHGPNGAQFGTVHTRSLLAGIGYGWHFGELAVSPEFQVGYSFNRSDMTGDAPQAFGAPGSIALNVDNAWVVKPQLKAEYFITHKLTFRTSVDYVRTRPAITVTMPDGTTDNHWGMSNVHANVGVGFYPFRR